MPDSTAPAMLPTVAIARPALDWLLVSVIIPVKNDADRLAVCLASLTRQDYPAASHEVIVVDNGSTDDSRHVAEQAGAKVLCFPGLRVGALRNRGAQAANGEILAFVDSDHEVPEGWLSAAVRELSLQPDIHMIGAPYLAPEGGTWVQRTWELHRLRDRSRREVTWLASGNLFLRRADFDRIGGFSEDLVAAEDVDLCVRLKAAQGRIVSDMRLANIHHGEPPTLWQFFRKELWRGSSGIRAFLAHGMPLHELPSLAFPTYHLLALTLLVAAAVAVPLGASWLWLFAALSLLVLPATLLGLKISCQVRRPLAMPQLAVLYFTYGLARTAALFKR